MIIVGKDINIKGIEDLCERILSLKDSNELKIPDSLINKGVFGIEAHIIQLIALWLRNAKDARLFIDVESDSIEASVVKLCSDKLYGLFALLVSDHVFAANGEVIPREKVYRPAINSILPNKEERFQRVLKSSYLGVPCIKVPDANIEYENFFYENGRLVEKEKFHEVVEGIINNVLGNDARERIITEEALRNISEIIRELFTNTQIHARANEAGDLISKNFRCVIINYDELDRDRANKLMIGGRSPLFFSIWEKNLKKGKLPMLDISVIDTGPGYARRWTQKRKEDIGNTEEIESVLSCFRKHSSSGSSFSSGSGLTNVLRDLRSLRGWMRLRTGRTVVEKHFLDEKGRPEIVREDVKIRKAYMEGVVFNMAIPLAKKA